MLAIGIHLEHCTFVSRSEFTGADNCAGPSLGWSNPSKELGIQDSWVDYDIGDCLPVRGRLLVDAAFLDSQLWSARVRRGWVCDHIDAFPLGNLHVGSDACRCFSFEIGKRA